MSDAAVPDAAVSRTARTADKHDDEDDDEDDHDHDDDDDDDDHLFSIGLRSGLGPQPGLAFAPGFGLGLGLVNGLGGRPGLAHGVPLAAVNGLGVGGLGLNGLVGVGVPGFNGFAPPGLNPGQFPVLNPGLFPVTDDIAVSGVMGVSLPVPGPVLHGGVGSVTPVHSHAHGGVAHALSSGPQYSLGYAGVAAVHPTLHVHPKSPLFFP